MRKSIIILVLMFLIIPFSAKAYDCVLTGSGSTCTLSGTTIQKPECQSGTNLSCSVQDSDMHVENTGKTKWVKNGTWGNWTCGTPYGSRSDPADKNMNTSYIQFETGATSNCGYCSSACFRTREWVRDVVTTVTFNNNYQVTLDSNNYCGVSSITTEQNYSIKCWSNWKQSTGTFGPYNTQKPSRANLGADQCRAYEGETVSTINGRTYYTYSQFWNRCCGGASADTPDKTPSCYRKVIDEENHIYDYRWQIDSPGDGYREVSSLNSESACVISNPNYCSPSNISLEPNVSVNKCDDTLNFDLSDGNTCRIESSSQFYNISCSNNVKVDYKPGFSGNTVYLNQGQGFNYNIDLNITKTCTGVFSENYFNEAYDRATALINRAQDDRERNYYQIVRNDIVQIANTYNNWVISDDNSNVNASVKYLYQEKGKPMSYNQLFLKDDVSSNKDNKNKTNCRNLRNGTQVCDFSNYKLETKIKLKPTEVLIDRQSGETTNNVENSLNAGNKIYTSLNIDEGLYPIEIEINNIGGISNFTLNNNRCSINVKKRENNFEYRIIDVENPFLVNSGRSIGKNWLNTTYDYTKTIEKDIWSKKAIYTFNLSKSDITELKNSNSLNRDAYFGSCYKDENQMDSITRKICRVMN